MNVKIDGMSACRGACEFIDLVYGVSDAAGDRLPDGTALARHLLLGVHEFLQHGLLDLWACLVGALDL